MAKRPEDPRQLGLFEAPSEPTPPESAAPTRRFMDGELPDQPARDRIAEDLETNLLVEAGAGSGKTKSLVDRMVALVRTGTASVEEIAAVTFTRKAAAELRQRFQTALEAAIVAAREAGDDALAQRLDGSLREIDRAFIGTIHSFCARLLRERPVEAGVDPGFEELLGPDEVRQRRAFWRAYLERLSAVGDEGIQGLARVGLVPSQLEDLFDALVANPDVVFPADAVEPPADDAVATFRARVDALLDRGAALMPAEAAEKGWDDLQTRLRLLLFLRRITDWDDRTQFLDLMGDEFHGRSYRVVQNRWPDGKAAKALWEDWGTLRDGLAEEVLDRWWAHRYPIALRFARRAAEAFREERRRTGKLDFQDLLMLAAGLLRTDDRAREELGQRYRRLLVDEFQDTDPVQAEVLLLLSSPPDGRPWQTAVPRPGALFVVGDPKQSIYRFRRADIAVYNLVRDRFRDFGDVLELVANFRSLPPIGTLVDAVFGEDGRFGEEATARQAAFAPLRTRRLPDPERQGVYEYLVEPDGRSYSAAAADGARRLVPWIAEQIRSGRRSPGDFLILARLKGELATYARELEAWRIPVQVTGAGVDQTEELRELLVLMEALADPSDPVRVVAVLVGLLSGLDHDQLVAWALDTDDDRRRDFDITRPHEGDGTPVGRALQTLHRWWDRSRTEPADVLVGRILDEVGLVPLAAAREMGELRAGSVLFALDTLRVAALAGDTSIAAATEALRTALDADEAEAPLEPVRAGVARVMTLHQAKGLEAPVVALVHPVGQKDHPIRRHIERRDDGSATGWLVVEEQDRQWRKRTIARPGGWEEKEAEERRYDEAEQDRLLYVAATRAGEELVVARQAGKESASPWAGLYPWIAQQGHRLRLEPAEAPPPEPMGRNAESLGRAVDDILADRQSRDRAGYSIRTATDLAKSGGGVDMDTVGTGSASGAGASSDPEPFLTPLPDPRDGPDPEFRGRSWGSAVHGALDAAGRGATGDELRRICRSLLLELERPVSTGEPEELDELVALVESVRASDLWVRAGNAIRSLSEVPFAYRDDDSRIELPAGADHRAGTALLVEGVVDLAFEEPEGWVIVDYKTDVGTDPAFPRRLDAYRRQVEIYAAAWSAMTGQPVKERVLLFTSQDGQKVSW